MSCFICEISDERLLNVKLSRTRQTKATYADLIRNFVWKSYEFEIFEEDAVCPTCSALLEELDSFYSKSCEIESILMTQICRKYQVDVYDSSVYAVTAQQLQLFNLIPFVRANVYQCDKCEFATEHEDCLVPHHKLHEITARCRETNAETTTTVEHLHQCQFCEAIVANISLLDFHIELFHTEKVGNKPKLLDVVKVEEDETAENLVEYQTETVEQGDSPMADDQAEVTIEEIVHLRCPVCEFCCVQQKAMDQHVRSVHGRRSFRLQCVRCQFCAIVLDSLDRLIIHSRNHSEITYKCCICEMTAAVSDDVGNHFKELHMKGNDIALESDEPLSAGPDFLKCNQCGLDLGGAEKCVHFDFVDNDPHKCTMCDQTFDGNEQYISHLHSQHFQCDKCSTKCNSFKSLQAHFRRRHTKYPCPHCDKLLGSTSSLQAHLTVHGLNVAYKCTVCQKGFKAKSLFLTHAAIHSKEYNYTCHICGQKFIHQRSHRIHVQWHDNPRPHRCPYCEATYKHRSHLAVHKRSHFGERPNKCAHCERRFTSASKLKVHMVVHTGIYSHPCQVCGKGFMKRYKLAEHLAKAHNDNTMLLNKPKCEYKLTLRPDPIPNN